jgi:diguanylate cyclase (GGDEF)-like protein
MDEHLKDLFRDELLLLEQAKEFYETSIQKARIDTGMQNSQVSDEKKSFAETGYCYSWVPAFQKLMEGYERNLRTLIKLTKIGDGQQEYLMILKEKLDAEIIERSKAENRLEVIAYTDVLTGFPNRRAGLNILQRDLELHKRKYSDLTIGMMDIDGLKRVNDTLGHNSGDELIKKVSQIMKCTLRDSDVIARIGGDEFLLILNDCTEESATAAYHRALEMARIESEAMSYEISFSCGFKMVPSDNIMSMDEILAAVDAKMYHVKGERGKHR